MSAIYSEPIQAAPLPSMPSQISTATPAAITTVLNPQIDFDQNAGNSTSAQEGNNINNNTTTPTTPSNLQESAVTTGPAANNTVTESSISTPSSSVRPRAGSDVTTPGQTKSGSVSGLKVNQAAFIHKLYSMLEDSSISHLISWTASNDSFVILPGEEFSKVLSQYFKHTNVSSFVRQLNMYGFHKVNDTFHGSGTSATPPLPAPPDASQWEFKHGAGAFKRGDVESLRAIKRRASRQSVVHRDNVSLKSVPLSVPSTPPASDYQGYGFPPQNGVGTSNGSGLGQPIQQSQSQSQLHPQQQMQPQQMPAHLSNSIPTIHHSGYPDTSLESRILALEQSLWHVQDFNLRSQSRYNLMVDSLKKTQNDIMQLVKNLRQVVSVVEPLAGAAGVLTGAHVANGPLGNSLSLTAPSPGASSSATNGQSPSAAPSTSATASPRSFPRRSSSSASLNAIGADLDKLHNDILQKSTLLNQIEDLHHTFNYMFAPPPPPQIHGPEIQLNSNQRERNLSVFYDPLAPVPAEETKPNLTHNIQQPYKLGPIFNHRQSAPAGTSQASSMQHQSLSTGLQPALIGSPQSQSNHQGQLPGMQPQHQQPQQPSSGPVSRSTPGSSPSPNPPEPYSLQPFHQPFLTNPMYAYPPPAPVTNLPPNRDQRPGSFPYVSAYHHQRSKNFGSIPMSNPYGHQSAPTSSGVGTGGTGSSTHLPVPSGSALGKFRHDAAPFRRHTSSELLSVSTGNLPAPPPSMPLSISTPPDTAGSSRQNSVASSNSTSSNGTVGNISGSPQQKGFDTKSRSVQSLLNPTSDDERDKKRRRTSGDKTSI